MTTAPLRPSHRRRTNLPIQPTAIANCLAIALLPTIIVEPFPERISFLRVRQPLLTDESLLTYSEFPITAL